MESLTAENYVVGFGIGIVIIVLLCLLVITLNGDNDTPAVTPVVTPSVTPVVTPSVTPVVAPAVTPYSVRTEYNVISGTTNLTPGEYEVPTRSILSMSVNQPATIGRVEELAASKMGKKDYSYNQSNAGNNETYSTNVKSFWKYKFTEKEICSVEKLKGMDLSSTLVFRGVTADPGFTPDFIGSEFTGGFQQVKLPTPVCMTPLALQTLYHPDGEKAMAEASNQIGVTFMSSQLSSFNMEQVNDYINTTGGWKVPHFFQLYDGMDPDFMEELYDRAKAASYSAVIHTLDFSLGDQTLGNIPEWSFNGQTGPHSSIYSTNSIADSGFNASERFLIESNISGLWANSVVLNRALAKNSMIALGFSLVNNPRFVPNDASNPLFGTAGVTLPAVFSDDTLQSIPLPPGLFDNLKLSSRLQATTIANGFSSAITFAEKTQSDYEEILRYSPNLPISLGSHLRGPGASSPGAAALFTNPEFYHPSFLSAGPDRLSVRATSDLAHSKGLGYFIKGIQSRNEILAAFQNGADGVIISDHGGRFQPGLLSTIDSLYEARDLIKDIRDGVYDGTDNGTLDPAGNVRAQNGEHFIIGFDSGIRSGGDVAKALALGANFASVGRPATWGLTTNGVPGAYSVFQNMIQELLFIPRYYSTNSIQDFIGVGARTVDPVIVKELETNLL
jgi:isopentenyl diphosphate isomerase/L-lactate dehydrogenase-like FMN-dependent dehydrogenase